MSVLHLPQKFLTQPYYSAHLVNPDFWRLVDIQGFQPLGSAKATSTLQGTAKLGFGRVGRCVDFVADGDWLSYGSDPNLQLITMTGLAVVEVPSSPSDYATIFNTNVSASFTRGFVIRVNPDGTVTALMQDTIAIGQTAKKVRFDGVSTVVWSYNNVSGLLRIAIDGVLESFTYADNTFGVGIVGRNQYYHGDPTQAKRHKQYLFALSSECDKVASGQLREWSLNPWTIFQAPSRKLYFTASVGGTTYNQSTGGSITVAGALTKQTGKSLSGSSTPAGTLTRLISKSFGGSITSAGNIVKLTQRALSSSITGTGNLATMILFTASMGGSITPSGAITKMTMKALDGATTLAGAISKMTAKGLGGELTMTGALAKLTARALSGSVTVAGAVATSYQVLKSLAGSITPAGALGAVYIAFVAGVLKLLSLMGVGQ